VAKGNRCIICGEPIGGTGQLCAWCQDPRLEEVLRNLIDEVDSELQQATRIDVKTNPIFSLVADLGILGIRHPFLASPSKMLARLIVEGGKGLRVFKMSDALDTARRM